jgi:hypothetical protein
VLACRAIRAQQIQPGAQRQNSPFCTGQPATLDGTAAAHSGYARVLSDFLHYST